MLVPISDAGYPALGLVVILSAAFAPLPVSIALAAAGALARQGRLDLSLVCLIVTLAAVSGDCLGYAAGRYGISRLPLPAWCVRLIKRTRRPLPAFGWLSAHMGLLIFLTRWALTTAAPVVNVVAGARHYPFRTFVLVDLVGQSLWCAITVGLGYWLGSSGEVGVPVSAAAGALAGLAGVAVSRHHEAVALR